MAKAKVNYKKINTPIENVVLTLTEQEAQFLRDLLGTAVVGSGKYRNLNDSIWEVLYQHFECVAEFEDRVHVNNYKVNES